MIFKPKDVHFLLVGPSSLWCMLQETYYALSARRQVPGVPFPMLSVTNGQCFPRTAKPRFFPTCSR